MAQTPPPPQGRGTYTIPMPPLPSRAQHQRQASNRSHPRVSSLSQSSFTFGPESLVTTSNANLNGNGLLQNPSLPSLNTTEVERHHVDPNASVMAASPRQQKRRVIRETRSSAVSAISHVPIQHQQQQQRLAALVATPAPRVDGGQSGAGTQTQTQTELEEGNGEFGEEDWGIVDRMRLWRHDAMMQHLHDSAVFWGDKVLSWTGDPNDAFWLAQAHFLHQQYARAEQLLTRPFVVPRTGGSRKGKEREVPNGVGSTPSTPHRMLGLDSPEDKAKGEQDGAAVSKLVDMSVACRYLAAQCMVRSGRWAEALEMLGETNPWRGTGRSGPSIPNPDGGIKVEASMCYLRGVLMTRLNRQDRAKEHFMEALALDVKCYDAFHELINGNLLGIDEEWDFVQGLKYMQQVPEDADFVRLVYTIRLKKEKHIAEMALARQRLVEEYGMNDNPDFLLSIAEALYAQYRWQDAFTVTSRIQELVGIHPGSLPTHIACMNNLRHLHPRLFLLAHELVDKEPDSPVSWYAVGVYYLLTRKFLDARKFFSKANLMDPRFGPAWIGFAHSYSYEGEHDHAIVAYSTAARLFPGMHLPALFLGMEYLQINNLALAGEYFDMAYSICDSDPLLHNERGVLAFHEKRYQEAANHLERAIDLAAHVHGPDAIWAITYLNLGQAYRKLGRFDEAKRAYNRVITLNPRHAQGYACLGIISHIMGDYDEAIRFYHESLAIDPLETNTIDLLNLALEVNAEMPSGDLGVLGLPGGEDLWRRVVTDRQTANEAGSSSRRGAPGDPSGTGISFAGNSTAGDLSEMDLA